MTSLKPFYNLTLVCSLLLQLVISGCGQPLYAQIVDKGPNIFLTSSNGLIPEVRPLPEDAGEIKLFLEDEWYIGDVKSFDREFIINKPLKYEIIHNRLEMQINGQTMGLSHNHVKSFEWFNVTDNRRAVFLNCKHLLFKDDQPVGFLEILSEGKITLSSHKTAKKFQRSRNSPAARGHKKDGFFVNVQFYYSVDGGLIMPLPNKRKELFRLFHDKKDVVKQFIAWNGLVFKQKEDLVKIFDFYNLLSEK